jgi:hypothetical protein
MQARFGSAFDLTDVTVDGSGSLNLQFDHSWGFEAEGTTNFDGGVSK